MESRILPFPLARKTPLRHRGRLRLLAAVVLVCFSASVLWTAVVTMGASCPATGGMGARPAGTGSR
jgi:hypothetical protein